LASRHDGKRGAQNVTLLEVRSLCRDYGEKPMKVMKIGIIACLTITIFWVFLAISQLWFDVVSADIFFKLSLTAGILVAVILLVTLGIREYLSEKEMKSKDFIN
jgi:hypothetical protein